MVTNSLFELPDIKDDTDHNLMARHTQANIVLGITSHYGLNDYDFQAILELKENKVYKYYLNLKLPSETRGRGPDVALLASNKNSIPCIHVPILIGEIVSSNENDSIYQLIYYMISFARPYRIENNQCRLLGFILPPVTTYGLIVEICVNGWMSDSFLFSCIVHKYPNSFDNGIFLSQFLDILLGQLADGLKSRKDAERNLILQPISNTIRFGVEHNLLPMLRQVDNILTCNILQCQLSDFKSFIPSQEGSFERIFWTAFHLILILSSKRPVR